MQNVVFLTKVIREEAWGGGGGVAQPLLVKE